VPDIADCGSEPDEIAIVGGRILNAQRESAGGPVPDELPKRASETVADCALERVREHETHERHVFEVLRLDVFD
jgi:hypothetical protein